MSNDKIPVLVADGHLAYVRVLQELLEARNYEVITARNGRTAIELAISGKPDLILLGSEMSGMCAFKVCRRIREFSRAPIIMLDGAVNNADSARGFDAGADDYVSKFISIAELLIKLRGIRRRGKLSKQVELEA